MHCVRRIWGSYGYAFRGNAIAGTPAEQLNQISGDRLMRSLKRDVLLFESIYVVPVELNTVLNKLSEANRDTLLMLKDKSIITLYDDVFPPQECTGDTFRETLIKPSLLGDICHVLANETTMCRF